ncbi:hypothetical protein IU967_004541 [Salmonella enterica subsp. enterica serovar Panama]|nr:hypothetical protein [Salmonella enterica subsp. enterica serovar Panama]
MTTSAFCIFVDAEAQFMSSARSTAMRCRIGQTPQNDVLDAIPQRLPGDLQSVLVGEIYEKSSIQN